MYLVKQRFFHRTLNCHSHGLSVLFQKIERKNFFLKNFCFLDRGKEKFSFPVECIDRMLMHSTGVVPSASVVNFWLKLSTVDETEKIIKNFLEIFLKEFLGHCFATNTLNKNC